MAGMPWDDFAADAPQATADDAPPWAEYAQPQTAPVSGMAGALMAGQSPLPNRTAGQWATDVGGNIGRSAYNAFDSIAGLGDIATGGKVTPWLVDHGLDSKAARAVLDAEMSPQARAQRDAVQNAQGFGPTVKALLQNPAYAGGQVIESVGSMALGGVAGKGAALGARAAGLNAGRAALVGAGTGEGLVAAGGQAANTVHQTGGLTLEQTAAALGSGALTGIIGAGSAGLGGRLGASDIDAILSGAAGPAAGRGMLTRAGIGAGMEAGEETLQSSQEQMAQNYSLGNPLTQGIGNAAGQGAVLGGVMGAAGGLRRPTAPQPVPMPAQQQQGMPQPAPVPNASPAQPQAPAPMRLPADLARSAPRYNFGEKSFTLNFESDIDKAAYIAAQKIPSKRDADFLKFAMRASGLTESQVRSRGEEVRSAIKAQAQGAQPGMLTVPATSQIAAQAPAPQGLHAQVMAATQPQQAPSVPAPTPFAGSSDINPMLDRLGVQGEQRNTTLKLLEPVELNVQDARRGVQSNAERDRLAQLIGLQGTDARVFNRKIGEALNAEQTVAAVTNVQDHLKDVLSLQQRIATGQASDIDRASFVQSLGQLRSTFADLAGARAEAGRALSAYKRQAMDYNQAQAVLEAVNGAGGADNAAKALGKAMQSGGLSNAAKLIRQPEGKMSRLLGYYYRAALLSGVRTHAVNITSNTMTLGNEIIERGVAAGVSGVKNIFKPGSGQTVFAEPVDMLVGMAKNTMQAGSAAADAFVTGDSPLLGGGKQETDTSNMNSPRPPGALPTAAWAADRVASLPYRALGAEDAWFASLNYAAEMRTLARQQAVAEKKLGTLPPGMKLSQRIDTIVQNPTSKMIEAAGEHARTATFNTQAGDFTQAIMRAKAKMPWLNLIVPFIRTPVNIVKYGVKRMPLAGLMPSVRADIMAGGAKQERAIARVLWGTSVMIGAGALAQAGYITGAGPDDKEEKAALMATGWRPYSIKSGDTYHEYSRLDPFSQWLGLASDLATMDYQHKDAGDLATTTLSSLVNNTVNKTYMQGVSNLVEFLQDPQRNAGWYVRQMVGTLAQPVTLASNIASENDPYARETNSVLDQIRYRTPGLRQDLPAKRDHFGEPVPNRTYPGGPLSIAAPIAQSKETTDPVRREAARIGWAPGKAQPHFTVKKERYDLNDEQMAEFNELAGKLMHKSAQRAMQSKGWAAMGDDEKRDFLDAELKKARTAVRLALIPLVVNGNRRAIDNLLRATGHPGVK